MLLVWVFSSVLRTAVQLQLYIHAFGSQKSHVLASHPREPEIDTVAHPEARIVQQRLNVAEVGVNIEVEVRQAREPTQRADK